MLWTFKKAFKKRKIRVLIVSFHQLTECIKEQKIHLNQITIWCVWPSIIYIMEAFLFYSIFSHKPKIFPQYRMCPFKLFDVIAVVPLGVVVWHEGGCTAELRCLPGLHKTCGRWTRTPGCGDQSWTSASVTNTRPWMGSSRHHHRAPCLDAAGVLAASWNSWMGTKPG